MGRPFLRAAPLTAEGPTRPKRNGQRLLSVHVEPTTLRAVKGLAVEQDTTNTALIHEAVSLLLKRHGKAIPESVLKNLEANRRPLPDAQTAKPPAAQHG